MKQCKVGFLRVDGLILLMIALQLVTGTVESQVWETSSIEGGSDFRLSRDSLQVDTIGRIHTAHLRDGVLIYSLFNGSNWLRESVATGVHTASNPSTFSFGFCIDAHNIPHISYRKGLRSYHAFRDESGWNILEGGTFDQRVDDSGNIHSIYYDWDYSIDCDNVYYSGPAGSTELGLSNSDGEPHFPFSCLALRDNRFPTVIFTDCDRCSVNLSWVSDNGGWTHEKLDSTYFQWCSTNNLFIAHDSTGAAHVMYSYGGSELNYLCKILGGACTSVVIEDDIGWFLGSIATDTMQAAHIGYRGWDETLEYARIDDGVVHTETIDSGEKWGPILSSGVLPDLTPLVLAYNEPDGVLVLWTRGDEVWVPLVLDRKTTETSDFAMTTDSTSHKYAIYLNESSRSLQFAHQEGELWTVETLLEFPGETPGPCSLACDSQDRLHMACYVPDSGIVYGLKTGSAAWQMETIPVAGDVSGMDLATGTAGNPLICYQDGNLVLLNKPATEWETTILDDSGTISGDPSICTGSNDSGYVLYSRAAAAGTEVVFLYGGGMEWQQEIVHSHNGPAGSCDLMLNGSDQPRAVVAYSIEGDQPDAVWNVDLADRDGSGWSLSTIGTGRGITDAGIGLDSKNCEHIVCQDREAGCLVYRRHGNRWLPTLIADPVAGLPGVDLALDDDDQVSVMFRSESGLLHTQQNLPEVGVRLDMPYNEFFQENPCYLYAYLSNRTGEPIEANLFILLQYGDAIWFYPSWSMEFSSEPGMCFVPVDLPGGGMVCQEIIPWFDWSHEPMGCEGLLFYGALADPGLTRIFGDIDGLGEWEFRL